MAYGKGSARKDWMRRAIPMGVGAISPARLSRFLSLREAVLLLMRAMAEKAFLPEPLAATYASESLERTLCEIQNAHPGLNAVWREQARMRVKPALEAMQKRYFKRLVGCLRFCDAAMPAPAEGLDPGLMRKFIHVPKEIEAAVSEADFEALKVLAKDGQGIETFKRVIVGRDTAGLSEVQAAIVRAIHARVHKDYRCPDFKGRDDFVLQLTLDARMLSSKQKDAPLSLRAGAATVLKDSKNARYRYFLDVAPQVPRDKRLRLPLVIDKKMARRIDRARHDYAAITLELSKEKVEARLVIGKPLEAIDVSKVQCIVGRDFGYKNTVALAVMESESPIDLEALQAQFDAFKDKASARTHIESHRLPSTVRCIERLHYSGEAFMKRLGALAARIDRLRSRIDRAYAELEERKRAIVEALDLKADEWILPEMKRAHAPARAFFALLGQIDDLKRARRAAYAKAAAIKRHWFGFLSNVEVALAKKHNAVIAREDLTVLAIEKDAPDYKGRAFNKMINHGSRGQYARRATDKFAWHGVPECVVPAAYTSRACLRHGHIVPAAKRNGERIRFACCGGAIDHADEHAAETIAGYAFLRPVDDLAEWARRKANPLGS